MTYLYGHNDYANIYVASGATAQNIATGASYVKATLFTTNGINSRITADASNDKIIINKGQWFVSGSFSFTSDTNNVTWYAAVFLNGVEQNQLHWSRKIATGADVGNATLVGLITTASDAQDVDIRLRHDNAGTVAITWMYASLNVIRA